MKSKGCMRNIESVLSRKPTEHVEEERGQRDLMNSRMRECVQAREERMANLEFIARLSMSS